MRFFIIFFCFFCFHHSLQALTADEFCTAFKDESQAIRDAVDNIIYDIDEIESGKMRIPFDWTRLFNAVPKDDTNAIAAFYKTLTCMKEKAVIYLDAALNRTKGDAFVQRLLGSYRDTLNALSSVFKGYFGEAAAPLFEENK